MVVDPYTGEILVPDEANRSGVYSYTINGREIDMFGENVFAEVVIEGLFKPKVSKLKPYGACAAWSRHFRLGSLPGLEWPARLWQGWWRGGYRE